MPAEKKTHTCLVRTSELDASEQMHISHPLNERSELFMTRLSDPSGLSHVGVSLARLPPGKESFALHVHTVQGLSRRRHRSGDTVSRAPRGRESTAWRSNIGPGFSPHS